MTATIVHSSAPSVDLSEIVLTYLQAQQEAAPSMAFVEAMCVEPAQIERLGVEELDTHALRYAYLVATDQPVGWEDVPACLCP